MECVKWRAGAVRNGGECKGLRDCLRHMTDIVLLHNTTLFSRTNVQTGKV